MRLICRTSHYLCIKICAFLITIYFVNSTTGSGAYMHAFRETRNASGTSGERHHHWKVDPKLSHVLRDSHLEQFDERFSKCNGIDIREVSIAELQYLFGTQRLTSVQLTDCYLRRIQHMNSLLHAVIEVNPDAIQIARNADIEREYSARPLSPLHGIPVLVKDNYDTLDSMESTAGSWAFLGIRPKRDADVVAALRKAGAIIIGKANLSEMSNFRGTNIPNGWSGRGGQTRNPYNLLEDPEGSSSGSAVAVASNLVSVAIGTETDGSLICPASVGSLCTIRSTHGLVSTYGVIPISHNQDTVGPLARTVMDMAILFDSMLPQKTKNRWACDGNYLNCAVKRPYPKPLRLGVLRYPFWDTTVLDSPDLSFQVPLLNKVLEILSQHPELEVVDNLKSLPNLLQSTSDRNELTVLLHDFKNDINNYLKDDVISPFPLFSRDSYESWYFESSPHKIATLEDIIKFNIDHPSPEGYNQELLIRAQATDGLLNQTYIEARDGNKAATRALLNSVMNKYQLDAIVVPSECRINDVLDKTLEGAVIMGNSVSAIAGYPAIAIPAGIGLKGVPFGIEFIGKPFTENKLFRIAFLAEQMIRKRESPRFLIQ